MALHTTVGLGDFILMPEITMNNFVSNLKKRWVKTSSSWPFTLWGKCNRCHNWCLINCLQSHNRKGGRSKIMMVEWQHNIVCAFFSKYKFETCGRYLSRKFEMWNLMFWSRGNWTPGISGQTCLAKSDLLLSILDLQRLDWPDMRSW